MILNELLNEQSIIANLPSMHHQQWYHMQLYCAHCIATLLFLTFESASMSVDIVAVEICSEVNMYFRSLLFYSLNPLHLQ